MVQRSTLPAAAGELRQGAAAGTDTSMLFNSDLFVAFFLAFVLCYYLARRHRDARNMLIVLASFVFYGAWDYRFLTLLILTSLLDYGVARWLGRTASASGRRWLVGVSVAASLGLLGYFKYWNFFAEPMADLLAGLGLDARLATLEIVLPVGLSFYTFQTMSYVIDVYRGALPAERSVIRYLAYVAFFPQLVAGPIERATRLLPQFRETRVITRPQVEEGTWLILWGLFKKVVLADNLAPLVDLVYGDGQSAGPAVIAATIAFGLQIYCDFSGYTDIARGLAKVLGFELTLNFNLPYAASSLRDFWRRWHISLSTWLRDYLYVSLGGNRRGEARTLMNLAITMLLGGLWHGAAANFLLWGAWHGFGLIVNRAWERWRRPVWALPAPLAWVLTMAFVFYGWLLFRSSSAESLYQLTSALGTWTIPQWFGRYLLNLLVLGMPLMAMQLWQWRRQNLMVALTLPGWSRALLQGALLWGVLLYWSKDAPTPFIYFQF